MEDNIDINLGGDKPAAAAGMDEAVRAAVRAFRNSPGAANLTESEIAEARAKAEKMVSGMGSGDVEGLKDFQNHVLSMGLPATRTMFRLMLKAAGLRGAAKEDVLKEITAFSPITEEGCYEVVFHDKLTGTGNVAYLVLKKCPRTHDLGAQLTKLQTRCAPDKWPAVLKQLSMLISNGRSVYAKMVKEHPALLEKLAGPKKDEYSGLKVDNRNTTLFLEESWPDRVGIYVYLGDELKAQEDKKKGEPKNKGASRRAGNPGST